MVQETRKEENSFPGSTVSLLSTSRPKMYTILCYDELCTCTLTMSQSYKSDLQYTCTSVSRIWKTMTTCLQGAAF